MTKTVPLDQRKVEIMPTYQITPEIVVAYWLCQRKAFLLLRGDAESSPHEYVKLIGANASISRKSFLDALVSDGLKTRQGGNINAVGNADVIYQITLQTGDMEANIDALVHIRHDSPKEQRCYEPYLVVGTHTITKDQKIRLAAIGKIFNQALPYHTTTGVIVNALGNISRIELTKFISDIEPIIEDIRRWNISFPSQPPPIFLNKHCPICTFKNACLDQAEIEDNLSLLDHMTPKIMRKYHKKGIFTVKQLSYLFKPRRHRKNRASVSTSFNLELQALALRTGNIYVHQSPTVPKSPIELFLDIEGVPDRGYHYLIGLVISKEGRLECQSLWADTPEDERVIFAELLSIASEYSDAPIYHYGSYEQKCLQSIYKKYDLDCTAINKQLVNATSFIFGKVYFPTMSNTLKDLGRFLGAAWSSSEASGLQSIVWRLQWEIIQDDSLRDKISAYNFEDCQALRLLVTELRNIGEAASERTDIDFADNPKKNATPSGQDIHNSLEGILKSAHANYKKNRIRIRQDNPKQEDALEMPEMPRKRQGFQRIAPTKVDKVIHIVPPITCPQHADQILVKSNKVSEKTVFDLIFTKSGCKKTITKYIGNIGYCPLCLNSYLFPQNIGPFASRIFGNNFRAWIVYQRIILRLPYQIITQVTEDLFREHISQSTVVSFIGDFAKLYAMTEEDQLNKILASRFVHVDETKINIQGKNNYVWVITDGIHVVFRLTETREATLIHGIMNGYKGVLISDFYAGYDSCNCRQQKCLVHLIRDMNDDLWDNPYNLELEDFISAFKELLVPIMVDVQKYGLKHRHLNKHKQAVQRFYKLVIDGRNHKDEIVQTYQKRFISYRESLFRFLDDDDIPWNNNIAERAIRHLAVQRNISKHFHKRVAEHYLILLGIAQTCRFQEKSFLEFLISCEKDVDNFKGRKRSAATKPV